MKNSIQSLLRGPFGSWLIANYMRFVSLTSRHIYEPSDPSRKFGTQHPVIYATWHGHSYIFGFRFRNGPMPTLMAARHGDGRLIGNALKYLGVPVVFGGGSTSETNSSRGGAKAFLQLLKEMKAGRSVTLTADIPKRARIAGAGIILMARKSGAPIIPAAMTTSRRKLMTSWDQMQINLPFSRLVYVIGEPIYVPNDGSPVEIYQQKLQDALNAAQDRAFDLADQGRDRPRIKC